VVINTSLSTYAENLLTNSMRNLSGCSHIFLEILNRSRGGRPPDWNDQPEICIESQPYISFVFTWIFRVLSTIKSCDIINTNEIIISFVVEESYFIIKNLIRSFLNFLRLLQ